MKRVIAWFSAVGAIAMALLLIVTSNPSSALAADGWQAASDNYFGQSGTIAATKFAAWNNQLWAGTENDGTGASLRTTSSNFFASGTVAPIYSGGKTITAMQQFFEASNSHNVGQTMFVAVGNKVFFQDPLTQQWVDSGIPSINDNGSFAPPLITDLYVFNNYIYAGSRTAHGAGAVIFRHSTNLDLGWETVVTNGFNSATNYFVNKLFTFNGYIYAQFSSDAFGGLNCSAYIRSNDGTTWGSVNATGAFFAQGCIGSVLQFQNGLNQTSLLVGIDTNIVGNGGQYSNLIVTTDGVNYVQWATPTWSLDPPWNTSSGPFSTRISALLPIANGQYLLGTSTGNVLRACILGNQGNFFITSYQAVLTDHDRVNDLISWNGNYYASLGQGNYGDQSGNVQPGIGKIVRLDPNAGLAQFPSNSCANAPAQSASLTLNVPAKVMLTPDQLRIGMPGNVGTVSTTFNPSTGLFSPATAGAYTFTAAPYNDPSGADNGGMSQGYTITVQGFVKGGGQLALGDQLGGSLLAKIETKLQSSLSAQAFAPPFPCFAVCAKIVFPYRLTFKTAAGSTTLPKSTVATYQSYVNSKSNTLTNTYFCNSDGTVSNSGNFLCVKENVTFTTVERGTTSPLYTLQAIPLGVTGSISLNGNVAAPGSISGFTFAALSNSIAVGGTISSSVSGSASKSLASYINQNTTKFSYANVQQQLNTLFAKRSVGTPLTTASFAGTDWYLNSNTADPANSAQNSYSTPPEGKLWNINQSGGALSIPGDVTFHGSGTIVINGDVTFGGAVHCSAGTRLGIIANGGIQFTSSVHPQIDCGAYTALPSTKDINFNYQVPSNGFSAKGIFVAGGSVRLPSLAPTINYSISYDDSFGSNPTVLYQELLKVIFTAGN